jgi:hypothetical protein
MYCPNFLLVVAHGRMRHARVVNDASYEPDAERHRRVIDLRHYFVNILAV